MAKGMDKGDKTYGKNRKELYDTTIDPRLIEDILIGEGCEIDEEDHRKRENSREEKDIFSCE